MSVETRPVPTTILNWPKIRNLITIHKFIYVQLYFGTDSMSCGCYLYGIDSNAASLSSTPCVIEEALNEFCNRGLIEHDKLTGEIFVTDWPRWHNFKTPAARGALWSSIEKIQSQKLLEKVKIIYELIPRPPKQKDKNRIDYNNDKTSVYNNNLANFNDTKLNDQPSNVPAKSKTGIRIWTIEDQSEANYLEKHYGEAFVSEAVLELLNQGIDPLPSRIRSKLYASKAGTTLPPHWWSNEASTIEAGKFLKLEPRPGELLVEFRNRIRDTSTTTFKKTNSTL